MSQLDPNGEKHLVGVHPDLVRVVRRARDLCPLPFTCTEGVRSLAREKTLIEQGFSSLTDPLHCRHVPTHGFGHAVDLVPLFNGQPIWSHPEAFVAIVKAMKQAAAELKIPLRCGADWGWNKQHTKQTGFVDKPHHELPVALYP